VSNPAFNVLHMLRCGRNNIQTSLLQQVW